MTHLAGAYDANTKVLRLYVNGVLQAGSATLTGGFNATGPWTIGRFKWAGGPRDRWPGAIDDVRVYNFVETAAKIAALAVPLPPTISFPGGASVTAGGQLSVAFDAGGDTNVTKVKYSVDGTGLGSETTVSPAGGAKTVTFTAPTTVGEHIVYAASVDDGSRVGPTTQAEFTVTAAASLFGTVLDGLTFAPIEGAAVTLNPSGLSTTSDASGGYAFAGFAPGTYTLAGSIGGRCSLSGSVVVEVPGPGVEKRLLLFPLSDDLGYTCEEQAAAFTAAGTVLALSGDDAVAQVSLPFAFPFYGQAYRQAWVDTNGTVSFTEPADSTPNTGGAAIPAPATPNAMVAPFWDDLVVDASASVRTATTGSGTGQRFVIEWRNVHRKASTAERLSFETILAPDGTVTFNYDGLDNAAERGAEAVVGIEAPAGEDGLSYSAGSPVLASGKAIVFDLPDAGNPIEVFDLSGTLVDAAGTPVVGATIVLSPSDLWATVGLGGVWSFTGLVDDSYTVSSVTGGRCFTERVAAQVELTADTVLNLQLAPDYGDMGYSCAVGDSGFVPAANVLPVSGDDTVELALPFGFPYAGRTYTSTWVSTKGLLTFAGDPGFDISDNAALPGGGKPDAVVAALWDDLVVDGSASVRSQAFGSAPNRSVVVEWRNVYIHPDPAARVTFEIVLHEDGRIAFHYGDLDTDVQRGSGATIGLEDPTGTLGTTFSVNEVLLTGDSSLVFTPAAPGMVGGTLTAAVTGRPVAGATVTLTVVGTAVTRTTTTASDGGYQFTGVPVGRYVVEASVGGGVCAGPWAREPVDQVGGVSDVDLSVMVDGDEGGYTCTTGAQPFITAGVVVALTGDDSFAQVTPPFAIRLYGQTYTTAWIDTNGAVTLRQPTTSAWDASPIPSQGAPNRFNAAVYPFWHDWIVDGQASVRQATLGTAPNRSWVVEWRNVHAFGDPSTRVTFEVIFDEASGDITFAYADLDPANPVETGAGASTVGIEDASGTIAFQVLHGLPRLSSGQGMRFHPNPPAPGGVAGTVTCTDLPVSGASVAVAGQSVTTDANGTFTVSNVPAGPHAVIATVTGGVCHGSAVQAVTVGAASTEQVTFPLGVTAAGAGYRLTEEPVTFIPADDTVLDTLTQADDLYTQVSLPFPVTLYGQSYTTGWVDTNGVVSFVDPGEPSPIAQPIPSVDNPGEPNAAVYPFWHDWVVDTAASVRTATLGTAPNRQFVVEWRNVYSHEDPTTRVSFEVVFAETGGFTFAYQIDGTFLEQGGAATIGIENAAGTIALQYLYRHPVLRPGIGVRLTPPPTP